MASIPQAVIERARGVRLVLMDADGVLTDGRILVFADGNEARGYHARDGLAVRIGQTGGLEFGVISGRGSNAVLARWPGTPSNSNRIRPGFTRATQNSGEPLPLPMRTSAGL